MALSTNPMRGLRGLKPHFVLFCTRKPKDKCRRVSNDGVPIPATSAQPFGREDVAGSEVVRGV